MLPCPQCAARHCATCPLCHLPAACAVSAVSWSFAPEEFYQLLISFFFFFLPLPTLYTHSLRVSRGHGVCSTCVSSGHPSHVRFSACLSSCSRSLCLSVSVLVTPADTGHGSNPLSISMSDSWIPLQPLEVEGLAVPGCVSASQSVSGHGITPGASPCPLAVRSAFPEPRQLLSFVSRRWLRRSGAEGALGERMASFTSV